MRNQGKEGYRNTTEVFLPAALLSAKACTLAARRWSRAPCAAPLPRHRAPPSPCSVGASSARNSVAASSARCSMAASSARRFAFRDLLFSSAALLLLSLSSTCSSPRLALLLCFILVAVVILYTDVLKRLSNLSLTLMCFANCEGWVTFGKLPRMSTASLQSRWADSCSFERQYAALYCACLRRVSRQSGMHIHSFLLLQRHLPTIVHSHHNHPTVGARIGRGPL